MKRRKILSRVLLCVVLPVCVVGGTLLFRERAAVWVTLCAAVLSVLPFFLTFERKEKSTRTLLLLAALTALSVAGRVLFGMLPFFKPVTAFVIIAGVAFGGEAGFLTGSLSAVLSNFYFGQGPWTPFQMLAWGIIGLLSGVFAKGLQKSRFLLYGFGALSGVLFSLLVDVWTALWTGISYIAALLSALPVTAVYAVSNVVFLLVLARPVGDMLERIKTKYGL